MMQLPSLRHFLLALTFPLVATAFASGCGEQGEGERCDFSRSGDTGDCESGLLCVSGDLLGEPQVDRCCPPPGANVSDERCIRTGVGTGGAGGAGGTGGAGATGGGAGDAGDTEAGDASAGGSAGTGGSGGNDASSEACAPPCTPEAGAG